MSSLFSRVKERVRSRSRHRKSSSWYSSSFRPSTSGDDVPPVPSLPYDDDDDGPAPAPFIPRVSMDNSAFLITARHGKPVGTYDIITRNAKPVEKYSSRSSAPRISEEQRGREVVALRDMMEYRKDNPDDQSVLQTLMGTMVPERASSRKSRSLTAKSVPGHRRHASQPVPQSGQQPVSSDRKSSETQKSGRPKSGHARYASQPFPESQRASMPVIAARGKEPPPVPPIPQFNKDRALYAAEPRKDDGRQIQDRSTRVSMDQPGRGSAMTNGITESVRSSDRHLSYDGKAKRMVNGNIPHDPNLRLPQGFSLDNSEVTEVSEHVRPAVTQENIIKHRTEIVHEEITRDVHVHHYYTYLQPIKVVEVLAPKHYKIDQATGRKVEIPAPEGWVLPESMRPTQHDYTMVKGWTRHYLVNEQHPNGVLEPAPPSNDSPVARDSDFRGRTQVVS